MGQSNSSPNGLAPLPESPAADSGTRAFDRLHARALTPRVAGTPALVLHSESIVVVPDGRPAVIQAYEKASTPHCVEENVARPAATVA